MMRKILTPELFEYAKGTVFSEPQLDRVSRIDLEAAGDAVFAVEYLPGQFDQRADSAAQCIQLISQGERPLVRTAKVYVLYGALSEEETGRHQEICDQSRGSTRGRAGQAYETLTAAAMPFRRTVETLDRLLCAWIGPALDAFVRDIRVWPWMLDDTAILSGIISRSEHRDPTITEIRHDRHLLVRSLPSYRHF